MRAALTDGGKIISRFADTTGDGTGTFNANGNYAGSPTEFKLHAAPGEHIEIHRMIVTVEDSGLNSFDLYTASAALTNGVQVYVTDNAGDTVYNLTDPQDKVKTLGGWGHYCFDAQVLNATSGDDHFLARWTFFRSGIPVTLMPGWTLKILCEDDLTALTAHKFLVQGLYLDWGNRAKGAYA